MVPMPTIWQAIDRISAGLQFGYECRNCEVLFTGDGTCHRCGEEDYRLFNPFLGH